MLHRLTDPAPHARGAHAPAPAPDLRLREAVQRLGRLPVLSATVRRVRSLADSEDAGVGDMVAALEADQGLAADLLRYANSAACARPLRVRSIRAAVTLVGRKRIAELALEAATFGFFQRSPGNGGRSVGQLHLHAAAVATGAQAVAERAGANTDVAHLAGLLHDVGKLVMPLAFGDRALDAIAAEHPAGAARAVAEHAACGTDHAAAGALIAAASLVDAPVVEAIGAHHGGETGSELPSREAACVVIADEIAGLEVRRGPDAGLLGAALDLLGLGLTDVEDVALELGAGVRPGADLTARMAELERQARIDDLTGLLNRRHWLATVRRAIAAGERGSVLLCDVDHFKRVNDGFGHATGDVVLAEVARRLGHQGVAGRLGGDEFAVWVAGDATDSRRAADAILTDVAAAFAGDDAGPSVAVSIGSATVARPDVSLTAVLSTADAALYEAKHAGRGRAVAG
jgi:diguanylate cyclase (GGDEF)-like protein/putative nucleotidyltransferase with HDIG domain